MCSTIALMSKRRWEMTKECDCVYRVNKRTIKYVSTFLAPFYFLRFLLVAWKMLIECQTFWSLFFFKTCKLNLQFSFKVQSRFKASRLKLCQNKKSQTFVEMPRFWFLLLQQGADKDFKKGLKSGASRQTFGSSYFCQGLVIC